VKKHGNSVFHFIRSKEDFDDWKRKGYWVEGDQESSPSPASAKTPEIRQTRDPKKTIQKLVTHWSKPNWKDQNIIISRALKTTTTSDGKTINELDGVKYRDLKLKMCLKKWSLVDEQGQAIEVTSDVIDMLDPVVAQELLTSFEKVTEPTADDLKD
jgi:hypothetical protein